MKSNIVIVGLDYEYNLKVSKSLAELTDLYFLDVKEYINYALFSRSDMLEKCGVEYLEKQETSAIKGCSNFENSIICIPCEYFLKNHMYENFYEGSHIIYLYFSKSKLKKVAETIKEDSYLPIDLIVFEDRDLELKNVSNLKICVGNKTIKTVANEIINFVEGKR